MIEVTGVNKMFGEIKALDNIGQPFRKAAFSG